jgi:hypothetical protein
MSSSQQLIYLPWAIFLFGVGGTILLGYRSIQRTRREKEMELSEENKNMRRALEEAENSSAVSDEMRARIRGVLHPRV